MIYFIAGDLDFGYPLKTLYPEKSIKLLHKAVGDEISAVHQYMYFHFHCDDQGFDLPAGLFKRTAIEEMLHVERPAERILFLRAKLI